MALRKIISAQTGKATWQIDYLEPDGSRVRKNFKKKKDAEAELAKRISLKAENRYLDVKREYTTTLSELTGKYEQNFKHQPSWFDKNRWLKNFKKKFGQNALLSNIRYVDLETYKTDLSNKPVYKMVAKTVKGQRKVVREARGRKEATINREMSCIRHMFKKAVQWEMIEQSPFDRGQSLLLKENNARLRFLTDDEINQLLDSCPPYLSDIVECVINSGMRRAEVLSLEWDQVRNGLIYLTKTKNPRQIPINNTLEALFKQIRKQQQLRSQYVFTYQGQPVTDVHMGLNAALKKAEITDFTFHDLRHTFASHFVMRGGSLKDLQEILGHKNIQMTMRYAHLTQEHKKQAIKLLDGLTNPQNKKYMSRIVTNLDFEERRELAK